MFSSEDKGTKRELIEYGVSFGLLVTILAICFMFTDTSQDGREIFNDIFSNGDPSLNVSGQSYGRGEHF